VGEGNNGKGVEGRRQTDGSEYDASLRLSKKRKKENLQKKSI